MPYIITTTKAVGAGPMGPTTTLILSRRAVATLDEAREAAKRIVEDTDYPTGAEAQAAMAGDAARCEALTGPGALVLPDGTVIEVEQVDNYALYMGLLERGTPLYPRVARAEGESGEGEVKYGMRLIDAYNAAQ